MANASYEEGSEIQLDAETVALAAGWTEAGVESDIFRSGNRVQLAIRAKNAAKAAALITTLPVEYRPPVTVFNETGTVEVLANGEVKSAEGATALEASKARVYEIAYRAQAVSP